MAEGENKTNSVAITPLKDALESREFIDLCISEDIPVICIKKEPRKLRRMPFSVMYGSNSEFWLLNSEWDYFISDEHVQKIKDKLAETHGFVPPKEAENAEEIADNAAGNAADGTEDREIPEIREMPIQISGGDAKPLDVGIGGMDFGNEYVLVMGMRMPERVSSIRRDRERLEAPLLMKAGNEEMATSLLVETARNAILQNHASLANAMLLPSLDAKKQTQELVDVTRDLVRASTRLISANLLSDDLMNSLIYKSNGTIIQHMTRVYLCGLAFLAYFNKQVSRSHVVSKMRITFNDKYRRFYQSLMPDIHHEYFTLERIFLGGMRVINESDLYDWATGFLIHDVGKAAAVEYHEGEAAYNRELVMDHVKVGFAGIMGKTNYPQEAAIIAGYHHEYYGDADGYGVFRTCYEQYKKTNPVMKQSCCIAYDLPSVLDYKVMAYFPAKILEIVDVFDSLTDPNRKYRKAMTTEEALVMMQEEFIIKHPKIDIILFDMFSNFVMESPTAWQATTSNAIIQESYKESGIYRTQQAKQTEKAKGEVYTPPKL